MIVIWKSKRLNFLSTGVLTTNTPLGCSQRRLLFKTLLVINLTVILLTAACLQVSANNFSHNITFSGKDVPLKKIFSAIEKQTNYVVFYDAALLQNAHPVTLDVKNTPIIDVLKECLKDQLLNFIIEHETIVITQKQEVVITTINSNNDRIVNALDIEIKGRVTNNKDEPLQNINILLKGTGKGTTTDNNGNYRIVVPEKGVLVFSAVGFITKEVQINNQRDASLNVILIANEKSLEDVIVTGYTSYRKNKSPYASSIVSADKINQVPGLTIDQILQGRVPGMSVISTSGQPGQSASVVIRGISSISGSSSPLYVMDGIPIESNFLQTINPDDIESVVVLKDASAKALYGSRGSNGVLVITSKKGRKGKISVNYNSQYGFSNLSRPNFIMMNTEERLSFEEEIGVSFNRNLGPGWTYSPKNPSYISGTPAFRQRADFILDSVKKVNVDWRDMFFQKGKFQEHQVSFSGGNDGMQFYTSLNYYDQEGVAKRTGLKRYSLRSNLDFKADKLTGGINLALGYSNSSFTEGEGSTGAGTAMSAVYYALPYEYPYAPDGTLVHPGNRSSYFILDQREGSQALERLLNSSSKTDQVKSIIGGNLAYQILPSLKVSTRAGIDYRNSTDISWINPDSYYGSRSVGNTLGGRGRFDEGTRRNFNVVSTSGLTYAKLFNKMHDVEVSGIYEYIYSNFNSFGFTGFGLDGRLIETPAAVTNGSATFLPSTNGGKTSSALASFLSIARYTYNEKYTLTGSYRYDGSTQVAPINKWKGFYSVGANWAAKKENFLKDVKVISDLRFRASYGLTASPFNSNFGYLATYSASTSYGGVAGIRPSSPGNANYDWEYVKEANIGFDLNLFASRRLRITSDVYNRITSNMFFNQPLSATSGFATLPLSSGKMQNRGIEFDISGDVIKNKSVTWTIGANGGYNKNKILAITPLANELLDGSSRIFKVGFPYGTYYAPDWAGVNPQTGDAQYYNLDGSITTTYNSATQSTTNSGSLYPKLTGGFNSSVSWRGFSANVLFSFVSEVMRWNNEDFYNENQRYATSNQSTRMLNDRWKKPGDIAILQRYDVPRNFTSKDIQDASFLRLRNLNIGYSVPKSIMDRTKVIKTMRVFIQGQNLLTWTKWRGLDPENNDVYGRFQYPNTRTYTAGLNVNF